MDALQKRLPFFREVAGGTQVRVLSRERAAALPVLGNLEIQLRCCLHHARRVSRIRAVDQPEVGPRRNIVIWTTQCNAIKGIEHFPAELEAITLREPEVLAQAKVPGINPRPEAPSRIRSGAARKSFWGAGRIKITLAQVANEPALTGRIREVV